MSKKQENDLLWIVQAVETNHPLRVGLEVVDLEISWADGMMGVMPVFDSYDTACKYAEKSGATVSVFEIAKKVKEGGSNELA